LIDYLLVLRSRDPSVGQSGLELVDVVGQPYEIFGGGRGQLYAPPAERVPDALVAPGESRELLGHFFSF
jgi:hypothetical protein